jgi:hypothetical protein
MVRFRYLLISALAIASITSALDASSAQAEGACTNVERVSGVCATNDGESVTLTGNEHSGGGQGSGQGTGSGGGSSSGGSGAGGSGGSSGHGGSAPVVPAPPLRDGYGVTATAPVTLSDIASFRPVPGTDHMQPNGWTIIGLSTNFYAVAAVQVQDGTLLGRAASVRFTPRSYHWAYGDGLAATRSVPGGTWRAQGIREFDPTPTSHVFTKRGSYTISLSIDFGAEYRYDGGVWTPIAGVIPLPANPLNITVGDAKTVLVAHDCGSNPRGPGC